MKSRAKKTIMLLLVAVLLFASGRIQTSLNRDRDALGITISLPLQDAPPVLALTTQALGGFRGLISNFLWMRANDLQINDQYFEAAQLADWITDLEPHFSQVWVYQGWNMAYNISVKFKDFPDRWRWVRNGIELLRDRGLRYNPNDLLIYRELGWFYQHKMGADLDDANHYYKTAWAQEMTPFFGPYGTNIDALVNPRTPEERTNAYILTNVYKIDPVFAQKVNNEWGPLDWRVPESHAIYWGTLGLEKSREHPDKVDPSLVIQVRRIIYQSMMQAFEHGQMIDSPFLSQAEFGPNLAIIPKTNEAYEKSMEEDPGDARNIAIAHRNFLLNATYYLYEANHVPEAQKWYDKVRQEYPDKTILQNDVNSFPKNVSLDEYCVARVQGVVTDTSPEDTTATIEGLLAYSYDYLVIGQDDRYAGFRMLAGKVWETYMHKIRGYQNDVKRTGLAPFKDMDNIVLSKLLDPVNGLPYAARATIRSQPRIGGNPNMPYGAISTNAVVPTFPSTNAPVSSVNQ
jgi:hypothetical protein